MSSQAQNGDLENMLSSAPTKSLPDTNGAYLLAQYTSENLPLPPFPTTNQTFPVQPPGVRRHTG